MLLDHRFKFRHHLLVGDYVASFSCIDTFLYEGQKIRLAFRNALNSLGGKPGSAAALPLGNLIDEGERLDIEPGCDDCGFAHGLKLSLVYI